MVVGVGWEVGYFMRGGHSFVAFDNDMTIYDTTLFETGHRSYSDYRHLHDLSREGGGVYSS